MNGRCRPRWFARLLPALACCLLAAGCAAVSLGASNSPDWCPNPRNPVTCPP